MTQHDLLPTTDTRPRVRDTDPALDATFRELIARHGFAVVARRAHWILYGERLPEREEAA